MRHTLALLLLSLGMAVSPLMAQAKKVHIHTKDGEVLSFSASTYSRMTFDDGYIVLLLDDAEFLYPLSDYLRVSFTDNTTALSPKKQPCDPSTFECSVHDRLMTIRELSGRKSVRIYTLSGILIGQQLSDENGTVSFNLGRCSEKTLVVHIDKKAFKINLCR